MNKKNNTKVDKEEDKEEKKHKAFKVTIANKITVDKKFKDLNIRKS